MHLTPLLSLNRLCMLLCIGLILPVLLPSIASMAWLCLFVLGLVICSFLLTANAHIRWAFGLFFLAYLYSFMYMQALSKQQLSSDYLLPKVDVVGQVVSLPKQRMLNKYEYSQRFVLKVIDILPNERLRNTDWHELKKIKNMYVSWYQSKHLVKVGDIWQFTLKPKRPVSLLSEGAFDFERWLLQQSVTAKGNVKNAQWIDNKIDTPMLLFGAWREHIRHKIIDQIDESLSASSAGVLLALLIGDKSYFSNEHRLLFQKTGIAHLMAISGLHIGMVAALAFAVVYFILTLLGVFTIAKVRNVTVICSWGSVLCALCYAMLAGFTLPTQRAFIMLLCLVLLKIFKTDIALLSRLLVALAVVLCVDPLAIYDKGLYLSFIAVFALLIGLTGEASQHKIILALKSQFIVFVFMLPLGLSFFYQAFLLSPLANLLLIPLFAMLVLPLALLGLLLLLMNLPVASPLLSILDTIFISMNHALACMLEVLPSVSVHSFATVASLLLLLALAVCMVLFKRKVYALAYVLVCASVFLKYQNRTPLSLHVLNVGQGLSVLVETTHHRLLYDVGASFPSGFNMVDAVIKPYFSQRKIATVDTLMISHADNDHAGGLKHFLDSYPVNLLLVGDEKNQLTERTRLCLQGQTWQWDGARFDIIYADPYHKTSNNRSCVVLVRLGDVSILLTGDISRHIESDIADEIRHLLQDRPLTVMIAPHHGSNTSSSAFFLNTLKPRHVVFSAAYQHHFSHPHSKVVQRYKDINTSLWNTADYGTIRFQWSLGLSDLDQHTLAIDSSSDQRRFWRKEPE